jgi:hypothetical protein
MNNAEKLQVFSFKSTIRTNLMQLFFPVGNMLQFFANKNTSKDFFRFQVNGCFQHFLNHRKPKSLFSQNFLEMNSLKSIFETSKRTTVAQKLLTGKMF